MANWVKKLRLVAGLGDVPDFHFRNWLLLFLLELLFELLVLLKLVFEFQDVLLLGVLDHQVETVVDFVGKLELDDLALLLGIVKLLQVLHLEVDLLLLLVVLDLVVPIQLWRLLELLPEAQLIFVQELIMMHQLEKFLDIVLAGVHIFLTCAWIGELG